jgi:hypothetical protein
MVVILFMLLNGVDKAVEHRLYKDFDVIKPWNNE